MQGVRRGRVALPAPDLVATTDAVLPVPFEDRVAAVAADLADGPTRAYEAIKRLVGRSEGRSLGAQLADETDNLARVARSDDYARGYAAFFDDGAPDFRGR